MLSNRLPPQVELPADEARPLLLPHRLLEEEAVVEEGHRAEPGAADIELVLPILPERWHDSLMR